MASVAAVIALGCVGIIGSACRDAGASKSTEGAMLESDYAAARKSMIETQIVPRGIHDPAVLDAIRQVPRHLFVPEGQRALAYTDGPLAIGAAQTISQPYIVALMTELARVTKKSRVLEIGTGSGYQAAVLSLCAGEVNTIEIVPELGARADGVLRELGYANVHTRIGDGYNGWAEKAPFDAIVVTAAPDEIPQAFYAQLAMGGRLVVPVGTATQELVVITRFPDSFRRESIIPVRFVPMTGKALED